MEEDADQDDVVAILEQAKERVAAPTGGSAVTPPAPPAPPAPPKGSGGAGSTPSAGGAKPRRTGLYVVIGVVAAALLGGGAYLAGHASGSSVPAINGPAENTAAAAPNPSASPVDQAAVAALMEKIASDPKDAKSLLALGDIYFNSADYKNASAFYQKVVAVNPTNDAAWVAAGASAFNSGDDKGAQLAWEKAAALNPKNAEAHYDLGFLYLSAKPPQQDKAKAEWEQVIKIDPKSDLAKTVKSHLDSLMVPASPTPSPASS